MIRAMLFGISTCFSMLAYGQGVREFGPPEGKMPLRGFGDPVGEVALLLQFPKAAAALKQEDREGAEYEIQRTDANGDGSVTDAEWRSSGYQTPDRFRQNDLNGDGVLTLFEHSLRWAQYRIGKEESQRQRNAAKGQKGKQDVAQQQVSATATLDPRVVEQARQAGQLSGYLMQAYDADKSGAIEFTELPDSQVFVGLRQSDQDRDGKLGRGELGAWLVARIAAQTNFGVPAGTPEWFLTSDINGDGQVVMSEYLNTMSVDTLADFQGFDRNADGMVTVSELAAPEREIHTRYTNDRAYVIEAEKDIFAQIVIRDSSLIQDINVQIGIAKNGDDDIELTLVGPDGTRAALYFDAASKPWGGGRLFQNTIIDHEAPFYKQRLQRPPAPPVFRPQGAGRKGRLSLDAFYGKSLQGTWRLVIRNKSPVPGLLENWTLMVTTKP